MGGSLMHTFIRFILFTTTILFAKVTNTDLNIDTLYQTYYGSIPAKVISFGGYSTPECKLAISLNGQYFYLKKLNSTCTKFTNSNGDKIICNSNKSVCKTRKELIAYIQNDTRIKKQSQHTSNNTHSSSSLDANDVATVAAVAVVGYGLYKLFGGGDEDTSSSSSSSYSSGSDISYVMVEAQCINGLIPCIEKDLHISGGPGEFSPNSNGAYSGAIHKGYNGLAGTYNFSVQFDNNICSGSFYIGGQKRNYSINLGRDCHDNGSREW